MMQMYMYNVCGQNELGQTDPHLLADRYMHFFSFLMNICIHNTLPSDIDLMCIENCSRLNWRRERGIIEWMTDNMIRWPSCSLAKEKSGQFNFSIEFFGESKRLWGISISVMTRYHYCLNKICIVYIYIRTKRSN
jgi:hypothetical protein